MYEVTIEKLDNQGRGICYLNNKITFVENALPTEIVKINITKESKKFNEAIVTEYIKKSLSRVESPCPYYNICGGCELLNLSYENTCKYKKEKLEDILSKYANIKSDIEIIKSKNSLNYRNKITLKVEKGIYGYYESKSHKLIEIKECLLAEPAISNFIKDIKKLNIKNGEVTIRSNYNSELLIWIKTKDKVNPDIPYLKSKHKIAGIILNDQYIDGDSSFIEIINHQLFTVSYDSFFQVNRDICSKLFNLVNNYIEEDGTILDLYCGVGTLGINATKKAKKAFGIEIVKNAVLNAITNSKINKRDNIYYMLGDVSVCLPKIKDKIDTIIVDPPRAGLDKVTKQTIIEFSPNKIIYVSCDPMTLARDLKELSSYYNIIEIKGLDMFPHTEHIETFCVLKRR
ncbi:MAG: class I SAM-dependent RNA methyltransferase [Candidatus Coprovivens sp.]